MELVFTTQDLEPLPKTFNNAVTQPLGFLNSNYKQLVNRNYNKINTRSVFGVKQQLKSKRFNTTCSIDTALKATLFLAVFLIAVI